jgi:hypothetical protein
MTVPEPFSQKILNGKKVILHLIAVPQQNFNIINDILSVVTGTVKVVTCSMVWILGNVPGHHRNNL